MSRKRNGERAAAVVEDEDGLFWRGQARRVQVVQQGFVGRVPGTQGVIGALGIAREGEGALGNGEGLHGTIM